MPPPPSSPTTPPHVPALTARSRVRPAASGTVRVPSRSTMKEPLTDGPRSHLCAGSCYFKECARAREVEEECERKRGREGGRTGAREAVKHDGPSPAKRTVYSQRAAGGSPPPAAAASLIVFPSLACFFVSLPTGGEGGGCSSALFLISAS